MKIIKIYTITECPFCNELKEYLEKDNIDYVNINVDLPENENEYNKIADFTKSDQVPIVRVNEQLLVPNVSFKSIKEAYEIIKKIIT